MQRHPRLNSSKIIDQEVSYTSCINDQTTVGWRHFICGRIISSFIPVITQYYKRNKVGRRYSAKNWIKTIIINLLSIYNSTWQSFCSQIHTTNTDTQLSPAKEILLRLVQKYYDFSTTLTRTKK